MTTRSIAPTSDPTTHLLALDAGLVAVERHGTAGEPILLLHGLPGWRGIWRRVAASLADTHTIIVPDLLGFGESGEPIGDGHAPEQATMLLELLDALAIEAAHVVGFDFGGPVAVTLYQQAPQRVRSLTLANANLFTDTPLPGPLRLARLPLVGDLLLGLLFSQLGQRLLWYPAVGDKHALSRAAYEATLRWPNGVRSTRRIMQASLRDLPGRYRTIEATLAHIAVPTTILWGARDPFFALAQGQRLAATIPGARFVALPGCGHFVPEERPAAVIAALRHAPHEAGRPTTPAGDQASIRPAHEHGNALP